MGPDWNVCSGDYCNDVIDLMPKWNNSEFKYNNTI